MFNWCFLTATSIMILSILWNASLHSNFQLMSFLFEICLRLEGLTFEIGPAFVQWNRQTVIWTKKSDYRLCTNNNRPQNIYMYILGLILQIIACSLQMFLQTKHKLNTNYFVIVRQINRLRMSLELNYWHIKTLFHINHNILVSIENVHFPPILYKQNNHLSIV